MNFTALAFVDTFELVGSLRTRHGLFQEGEPRILPIGGPRKGTDEADEDFVLYGVLSKWAELKILLNRIKRLGDQFGGIEFGHVLLEMLSPGATLPWTVDITPYTERHTRLHLALRTNPQAIMYSGAETMHLLPGQLTAVNQRAPHSAINLGEWPRVHLICDFRRKEAAT